MPDTHAGRIAGSPDPSLAPPKGEPGDAPADGAVHSLADDISALFEDGKTYAQAEIAFQKSRASYAADRTKGALVFGIGALAFLHLALIALVVGLVIAFTGLIGPWLATLLVVGVLMIACVLLGLAARRRAGEIAAAFSDPQP